MNAVALITGSSRGIGRGIALALARADGMTSRSIYAGNEAAARECAELCRAGGAGRVEIVQGDVSKSEDRARMVEWVRDQFDRLDLLVNNAGIAPPVRADLLEATEASFDAVLGVNLRGPYFLTQSAARLMIDSRAARWVATRDREHLERFGLRGFHKSRRLLHLESWSCDDDEAVGGAARGGSGIAVHEIQPGIIASDMTGPVKAKYDALFAQGLAPINRWGQPEDVGACVTAIALGHLSLQYGAGVSCGRGIPRARAMMTSCELKSPVGKPSIRTPLLFRSR